MNTRPRVTKGVSYKTETERVIHVVPRHNLMTHTPMKFHDGSKRCTRYDLNKDFIPREIIQQSQIKWQQFIRLLMKYHSVKFFKT